MNPLIRHTAWHVPRPLDLRAMRAAAPHFVGRHDFQSFAANPGYAKASTVRTLTRCDLTRRGPLLTFIIEGDGFLYKMCRGIVGTLVQVGLGKFPAAEVKRMLAQKDRRVAGMTAPAHGLVLWKVFLCTSSCSNRKSRLTPATWRGSAPPPGAVLHLIEPFGFKLDDAQLKRAGMDYWQHVEWHRWPGWAAFRKAVPGRGAPLVRGIKRAAALHGGSYRAGGLSGLWPGNRRPAEGNLCRKTATAGCAFPCSMLRPAR